jgi:hypothetical protein
LHGRSFLIFPRHHFDFIYPGIEPSFDTVMEKSWNKISNFKKNSTVISRLQRPASSHRAGGPLLVAKQYWRGRAGELRYLPLDAIKNADFMGSAWEASR